MIRSSWLLVSYLAAAMVILAGPDQPEQAIDTERGFLTVHLGKAGLLSAAAHEHWVNAPIAGGTDQDRRRCRQGEGRAGNQLSDVHGVTLTRLLYERYAAFGKVARYFFLHGLLLSQAVRENRQTLSMTCRSPQLYFVSCKWKVRLLSAGRWALLLPIEQRIIAWSGARFD